MWWVLIRSSAILLMIVPMFGACKRNDQSVTTVYLASSLSHLAKDIEAIAPFDIKLDLVFLSSSAIAKQIEHKARCHAAIVADEQYEAALIDGGFVRKKSGDVAFNSLVLASNAAFNKQTDLATALQDVVGDARIIIADPDFVPLGRYTKEALKNSNWFLRLSKQFVKAHSARHAAILLEQGAAPFAILYESDIDHRSIHLLSRIEKKFHRPIHYPLLVCNDADQKTAQVLEQLFLGAPFKSALSRFGFGIAP